MEDWEIINSDINDVVNLMGENGVLQVDSTSYDIRVISTTYIQNTDDDNQTRNQNEQFSMRFILPDGLEREIRYGDKITYRNKAWIVVDCSSGIYGQVKASVVRDTTISAGRTIRRGD